MCYYAQVGVAFESGVLGWAMVSTLASATVPIFSLMMCQLFGAAANGQHHAHQTHLLQHRLGLKDGNNPHADAIGEILNIGGEVVNNTANLKTFGFDASIDFFKATVSALVTAVVTGVTAISRLDSTQLIASLLTVTDKQKTQ